MLEVIILSIALSMDAFAVSIGLGIKNKEKIKSLAIVAGLYFGIFQALMPFIGYAGGVGLKDIIGGYDYWIAFVLLLLIGGKMIYEAFGEPVEEEITKVSHKILLTLAIATSIDAMAAGFSLHLFNLNVYLSLAIIGITTFIFSILGVYLGSKGGAKYESKAEILGGVILIIIGFKILLQNLLV
ncbi:manganese efflux pump MntP [Halarcobacter bivalviorum]|uniref:manganese efflux pump MntP n=1 Tax=Halarcobacter bivalviorum TaxID=663364 RepID=UPI00100B707A|nr:manganese efflux pump MntP family protein [Halarcobacter bivalviorum]RXK04185.1 manganese efflux pump MntP [Halarcobacter bivalviorum]